MSDGWFRSHILQRNRRNDKREIEDFKDWLKNERLELRKRLGKKDE